MTGGIGVSYIVYSLQLLSNGYYLACGLANTNGINVYNLNTGHLISTLYGHTSFVFDLIQLGDVNLMASSSGDWTVRIWNMTTNRTKFILNGHIDRVFALKLINGEILASASWDTTIKLWNTTSFFEMRPPNDERLCICVRKKREVVANGLTDFASFQISRFTILNCRATFLNFR